MRRRDLLDQLAAAAADLGELAAPADAHAHLTAMCATLRLALGAAACSVARLDGDALVYEAADGAGAAEIIGVRLPLTRGLAGYVARTGQAMIVDQLHADERFARDVAERTGYVPTSLLVVPVHRADGAVLGVLSVLDRGASASASAGAAAADPLALAAAVAEQAALVLPTVAAVRGMGPLLLAALADAGAAADPGAEWPAALRRAAGPAAATGSAAELAAVLATLAELRATDPQVAAAAQRVLAEFATLAAARRTPRRLR